MESPNRGAVEILARAAGIPFGEACHGLEKLLYNVMDPFLRSPLDVTTGRITSRDSDHEITDIAPR